MGQLRVPLAALKVVEQPQAQPTPAAPLNVPVDQLQVEQPSAPPPKAQKAELGIIDRVVEFLKPDFPEVTRENFGDMVKEIDQKQRERAVGNADFMPSVVATVGGAYGGVPGAAAGGFVGEAARQAVKREFGATDGVPEGTADQLTAMAKEGAIQGAFQKGGDLVVAGAKHAGRYLMNRAANVTDRLAREFPELSQTLIDNAIVVSQGGFNKARQLLARFKSEANGALRLAESQGLGVEVKLTPEIAESFKTAIIEQAMKTGGAPRAAGQPLTMATDRLSAPVRRILSEIDTAVQGGNPYLLSPTHADILKSQLQRESKNLYNAMRGPNGTPAIETAAAMKAEFAQQLNQMIDDIAHGYMGANSKAREMLGATRAVRQAVRPGKNLYMALVRPTAGAALGGIIGDQQGRPGMGAAIGAAMGTPRAMSTGAIVLGNQATSEFLKQLPRGMAIAIEKLQKQTEAQRQRRSSGPQQ
jgi:hypothetical protein